VASPAKHQKRPEIAAWELRLLTELVRQQDPRSVYLEIGGRRGGSLAYFGRLLHRSAPGNASDMALSVDIGHHAAAMNSAVEALRKAGHEADWVKGDSTDPDVIQTVHDRLDGRDVDLLLIDGGHALDTVVRDVATYVPLCRPGAMVMFHDCGICRQPGRLLAKAQGIHAAWQALAANRHSLLVQSREGTGVVWL